MLLLRVGHTAAVGSLRRRPRGCRGQPEGKIDRSRAYHPRVVTLGLYAEEFEVKSARHLGNFPQAFSHLALIEAAARIILDERLEEYS